MGKAGKQGDKGSHSGERLTWALYRAPQGWGGVVAGDHGLVEVFLPFAGLDREEVLQLLQQRFPGADGESELALAAAGRLADYFGGLPVVFDFPCDLRQATPFQLAVYGEVARIPRGEVRSYREVSQAIGRPTAARGIGGAMAANRLPIVIPCHRVVASSGALTGYTAPGGLASKESLLEMEGVGFVARGRVLPEGKK